MFYSEFMLLKVFEFILSLMIIDDFFAKINTNDSIPQVPASQLSH